jgi:hypothetical protein
MAGRDTDTCAMFLRAKVGMRVGPGLYFLTCNQSWRFKWPDTKLQGTDILTWLRGIQCSTNEVRMMFDSPRTDNIELKMNMRMKGDMF